MRSTRPDLGLWKYLAMAVIALAAMFLWAVHQQSIGFERDSYNRCKDRTANTNKANRFYQRMAAIENANPYVDAKIRAERVAAYKGVQLAPPHCGPKP